MARTTSSTTRTPRKSAAQKASEAADAMQNDNKTTPAEAVESTVTADSATPAEVISDIKESTDMTTTDTRDEAVVDAVRDEADTAAEATETSAPAEAEKPAETPVDLTAFEASVATALGDKDPETGALAVVQIENVKTAYRELPGAKAKNAAKKYLNDRLRDAVNSGAMLDGMATMTLIDSVQNAGSGAKTSTAKPADPTAAYVERLSVLHLAYVLARADVPEGTDDVEVLHGKVNEKVEALTDQAEKYYSWVKSTDEEKGDEPDVDALVKKAVKAAQGKAASAGRSGGTSTPRAAGGERRSVRTHVAQVFAEKESGTFLKIAEIAAVASEEYPDASCSPGAITAAIKSAKGIDGFTKSENDKGVLGITKN